jgi:hypothetical protein
LFSHCVDLSLALNAATAGKGSWIRLGVLMRFKRSGKDPLSMSSVFRTRLFLLGFWVFLPPVSSHLPVIYSMLDLTDANLLDAELSIVELQNKIRNLLERCPYPYLRDYFAGFVTMPLKNNRQQKAARGYVCSLVGLPERM